MEYLVQNIVLPTETKHFQARELFYRGEKGILDRDKGYVSLGYGAFFDLTTYINSFSYRKWKRYSKSNYVVLYLDIQGQVSICFTGFSKEQLEIKRTEFDFLKDNHEERRTIRFEFPDNDCQILGCEISSLGNITIYGGHYSVLCDEKDLNDVNLSIATTTMKKEEFIIKNINLIKQKLLNIDDDISDHLYVHVVDNGKTLDELQINGEHVYLHPNDNAGGSGGFARGMIESLHQKECDITNVLLMDDDVLVLPESIFRTYKLLRLMKKEYQDHFIGGAMLYYEQPNTQHEDIGSVNNIGYYQTKKKQYNLEVLENILENELDFPRLKHEYTGWWFCCIPTNIIKEVGLPLPVFIRADDAEYSLRSKAKIITMNGLCVWHMGFVMKYSAAMDIYYGIRNLWYAKLISGVLSDIDLFHHWSIHFFREAILNFNYSSAELTLRILEDILKGPEFLEKNNGFELLHENSKLNEKYLPIDDLNVSSVDIRIPEIYSNPDRSLLQTFLYRLSYNGQRFIPDFLIKKDIVVVGPDRRYQPGKMGLHDKMLAVNPYNNTATLRIRDKAKFKNLMKRYKKDVKLYKKNKASLEKRFADSKKVFTSEEFWVKYLNLR